MPLDPMLVARAFDGDRLRQARQLSMMTKQGLAQRLGVTAAAVSQYESGTIAPRPDLIPLLAKALTVRPEFFTAGRPQARLEVGSAFFRSLRSTTARQRSRSTAYTEQLWELMSAIEEHVQLPEVALPGFGGGEVRPGVLPQDPVAAAQAMRRLWGLGTDRIPHLVALIEAKGIVTTIVPNVEDEVARIGAFSTSALTRPIIVLSLSRGDDVLPYRFSAAHELGHLVLHGEGATGDPLLEREADRFAAEFLTPRLAVGPQLPSRMDFRVLERLSRQWGVSLESLIVRSQEVGAISEATARRAFMRLNQLRDAGVFRPEPVASHPGEVPSMLRRAVELAETHGLSVRDLANQLQWEPSYVRQMLGTPDPRPALRLMPSAEETTRGHDDGER